MMRKLWLTLAVCAIGAVALLILHGWRQGGLALLPLRMVIC